MKLEPIILVPQSAARPVEMHERAALYRIALDAAGIIARKTGRLVDVASGAGGAAAVGNVRSIDLSLDLNHPAHDGTLQAMRADVGAVEDRLVLAAVIGRDSDVSGRGSDGHGNVGAPNPSLGGMALLGWGNVRWAMHAGLSGKTPDARLEYGTAVVQAMHEIGHALGLTHAPVLHRLDTIMGYGYQEFVSGDHRINPALFTEAEIATIKAHVAFARSVWSTDPGARMLPDVDATAVMTGLVPAGWALGVGRFIGDYGG